MGNKMEEFYYKRLDKELPQLAYATDGSVGLDTFVRGNVTIPAHGWATIPLNIVGRAEKGTFIGVLPRSSTFKKKGLLLANSLGVVDQDYCGDEDEMLALVYNTKGHDVVLENGDRLFQLVIFDVETPKPVEVEGSLRDGNRGGHGSTDAHFKPTI